MSPQDGAPPKRLATTHDEVADRALAQRGRGIYRMGGGAWYTAAHVDAAEGNRFPGRVDCTGLLAFCALYVRTWENTDAIVDDARGPRRAFRLVAHDEDVRRGDFLVTGRGHALQDHAAVVVEVLPTFVRGGAVWWRGIRCAHAAGRSWGRVGAVPEALEDDVGAVRVTDAYRWRKTGYFIRPLHVV